MARVKEISPKRTAVRYLQTMFVVDVLANIPVHYALLAGNERAWRIPCCSSVSCVSMRFLALFKATWERRSWSIAGYLRLSSLP
ncbi:MAG: hypothetical protein IPP94_18300 [Ignavibacteria bacterium]|nr:hypothetical protein [Ignavibacteria bacterium]